MMTVLPVEPSDNSIMISRPAADPYQARRLTFEIDYKHNEWMQKLLTEADSAASTAGIPHRKPQGNDFNTPRCPCTSSSSGDPPCCTKCTEKPLLLRWSKMMRETENDMVLSEEVEHHLALW